ncbi:MAG: DNA-binding response regulator [Verrucomicrobia bacterium]|nr:DNA-binding response regulator [Verrucomicrobiota bacterium]NBU08390.1 DNA-binding response regulator [Pseudomonadota bacterium]NDA65594.1 DNA-binding response regulator [Verrucomicrobiota bacterium]NDB75709.1 DNA-binding response regulator [Verrucomicrobiota bacterium]NDD37422.1 DNA-binding response regulator [Verrucomicrobiota bacterium]
MSTLKLLIADDHDIVRAGMKALIEDQVGWQVVAEAGTGRSAVEKAKATTPDVCVMDVTMPELNGLEAARQIKKLLPHTEILILTVHESEQIAADVLKVGARGYILKSDAGRELVAAVKAVSAHKSYFTSRISQMVSDSTLKEGAQGIEAEDIGSRLTPREKEIVQLLAEGKSNKEAASALNISVKTVETHRTNIMRKLRFHSVGELVRYAVRNNIVSA